MSAIDEYRGMLRDVALNMEATKFKGKPIDELSDDEIREALIFLYDNDQLTPDGRKTVEYMKHLMQLDIEDVLALATSRR